MPKWYVFFRRDAYALGPFEARNYEAAKQWVREFEGVKRLPPGTQIWRA